MYPVDNSSASPTQPTLLPSGPTGYYTAGNMGLSIPPTTIYADPLNIIQDELDNLVILSGGTLDKADQTQVWQAIKRMLLSYVQLSHMVIAGSEFNSGGPNISASTSFTPTFNGILNVIGTAGQQAGQFIAADLTTTGVTTTGGFGNTTVGATSNIATTSISGTVTAGTAVTITFAMTGTGASNDETNIGFTYFVLPTS
jgi:hypothetical protein